MRPFFSIIIPTYNCAGVIHKAIESVIDQTCDDFEILVMDDGSTDNTKDIVLSFNDSRVTYNWDKNFGGPARPRNRGIAAAKGEWICFLDADDWWNRRKLELSRVEIEGGADIVYHDLYLVKSSNQTIFNDRLNSTEPIRPMFKSLLCKAISIPNSSVVVRRDLLLKIGRISESKDLISVEDYDTWIRLSKLTEKFVRLPDVLGYYWVGGGNISAASPLQCDRIQALYSKYVDELSDFDRRQAVGFLAYRIARIAMLYGDRVKAQKYFVKAFFSPISLRYHFKTIYFFLRNSISRIYS